MSSSDPFTHIPDIDDEVQAECDSIEDAWTLVMLTAKLEAFSYRAIAFQIFLPLPPGYDFKRDPIMSGHVEWSPP